MGSPAGAPAGQPPAPSTPRHLRALLHEMRDDTGRPKAVIRLRIAQPGDGLTPCPGRTPPVGTPQLAPRPHVPTGPRSRHTWRRGGRRGQPRARARPDRSSTPRGCAPSAEADQTCCYPVRRGMTRDRAGSSGVVRSTRNTTVGWRIGSISGSFQGTHGPRRAWNMTPGRPPRSPALALRATPRYRRTVSAPWFSRRSIV